MTKRVFKQYVFSKALKDHLEYYRTKKMSAVIYRNLIELIRGAKNV